MLPGRAGQPLPYLGYAPGAYLGRVVDQLLKESGTAIHLDRVYETDMAEGLKVMALEGHGIAFLQGRRARVAAAQELGRRALVVPRRHPAAALIPGPRRGSAAGRAGRLGIAFGVGFVHCTIYKSQA